MGPVLFHPIVFSSQCRRRLGIFSALASDDRWVATKVWWGSDEESLDIGPAGNLAFGVRKTADQLPCSLFLARVLASSFEACHQQWKLRPLAMQQQSGSSERRYCGDFPRLCGYRRVVGLGSELPPRRQYGNNDEQGGMQSTFPSKLIGTTVSTSTAATTRKLQL